MVEEGKVPIEVRDTGGETLVHHAAYHGQVNLTIITALHPLTIFTHHMQVKCLEWLLTTIPKDEKKGKLQG